MADDKKPPSRASRSHDRDVLSPKHPTPAGVPVAPMWSEDTDTHRFPDHGQPVNFDDDTPIGLERRDAEAEFRLRHRVKETNTNVKLVKDAATATNAGVDALRTEMTTHVTRLDQSIAETNTAVAGLGGKVDGLSDLVIESTKSVNNAVMTMNQFQGVVIENQLQRSTVSWEAHSKVDANRKILAQTDQADQAKQARSFRYKVGATLLKVLAAAGVVGATAIATHFAERC